MMLNKKILVCVIGMLFIASLSLAGTVNWANSAYWYTMDGGSTRIPAANNWIVVCYQVGTMTIISQNQGAAWYGDGQFSTQFTSDGGIDVFTRIYNATSVGAATYYVNVDSSYTIPSLPGTTIGNYTLGATATDGSDWVVVPEPGTFALFGLGVLTIAARRRFRK